MSLLPELHLTFKPSAATQKISRGWCVLDRQTRACSAMLRCPVLIFAAQTSAMIFCNSCTGTPWWMPTKDVRLIASSRFKLLRYQQHVCGIPSQGPCAALIGNDRLMGHATPHSPALPHDPRPLVRTRKSSRGHFGRRLTERTTSHGLRPLERVDRFDQTEFSMV